MGSRRSRESRVESRHWVTSVATSWRWSGAWRWSAAVAGLELRGDSFDLFWDGKVGKVGKKNHNFHNTMACQWHVSHMWVTCESHVSMKNDKKWGVAPNMGTRGIGVRWDGSKPVTFHVVMSEHSSTAPAAIWLLGCHGFDPYERGIWTNYWQWE